MLESKVHSYLAPTKVGNLKNFPVQEYAALPKLGIGMDEATVSRLMSVYDAIQGGVTTASIGTPEQFLQNWLPGFVYVATGARKIDDIIGIQITGSFEDEEVVQGLMERTGVAVPYGDYTNVPYSSWNTNFERRTVVRYEEGMRVGVLEAARAARQNVDSAGVKRQAAMLQLDIQRNLIGFVGENSGANRTYGYLNDPGLPSYVTVATGAASDTTWASKTFLEIQLDIQTAAVALQNNSQDLIDPMNDELTLAVATAAVGYLSKTSDFGISVRQWISETYPKMRIVSAPQLNAASGGENVFYLHADRIRDESTDDGKVFDQLVQTKFQVLGVQQQAKDYLEDYAMASAGVMCKRPFAVVRYDGV